MKGRILAIGLGLSFVGQALAGSLKAEVESINKLTTESMRKTNIALFEKALKGRVTPDFKYSEDGGKPIDYKMMVAQMKQGFSMYAKVVKVTAKTVKVTETGSQGQSVQKHLFDGYIKSKDKKPHRMVFSGVSEQTYRKVKGKWMLASMNMKTERMTLDGKPMSMPSK